MYTTTAVYKHLCCFLEIKLNMVGIVKGLISVDFTDRMRHRPLLVLYLIY